ncbi:MAG TPA: nucleotidyltransferase domain-containing protein [Caldithrix abyssi]|uniref:Nucleotidyltransferase domain-containing protein n=1 Tax=Caldithrix abyssi TaxID=187145 RepID=A0A7V5PNS3_CALAY|nr:nucleotidyltransferase domain-containing protein [Caldithrix abyssi]
MTPEETRQQIKAIIQQVIPDKNLRIILYGSRARGDAHPNSDYDLALDAGYAIPGERLSLLKEKFEESTIPFKIDVVDLAVVSHDLKEYIVKEGEEW